MVKVGTLLTYEALLGGTHWQDSSLTKLGYPMEKKYSIDFMKEENNITIGSEESICGSIKVDKQLLVDMWILF